MKKLSLLNKQQGLSIIEVMIVITLGLILIGGMFDIFVSNKQSFRIQDGLARIQETGRYLNYILSNDIRMAGFEGCPKLSIVTPTNLINNPPTSKTFTNNIAIQGYDDVSQLPSWITSNIASGTSILSGTDIIVIRKVSPIAINLSQSMTATTDNLIIASNPLGAVSGTPMLISDCTGADVFSAGSGTNSTRITHPSGVNTSNALSKLYQTDARIYLLQTYVYYIKNTGRTNQQGQVINALYRQNISGTEEELAEGVENMQIRYGLDSNADDTIDVFQTAAQITAANNWANVKTVDISLLLTSVENINYKIQPYTFLGTVYTPTDKLLRRQWTSYIRLRNRIA